MIKDLPQNRVCKALNSPDQVIGLPRKSFRVIFMMLITGSTILLQISVITGIIYSVTMIALIIVLRIITKQDSYAIEIWIQHLIQPDKIYP